MASSSSMSSSCLSLSVVTASSTEASTASENFEPNLNHRHYRHSVHYCNRGRNNRQIRCCVLSFATGRSNVVSDVHEDLLQVYSMLMYFCSLLYRDLTSCSICLLSPSIIINYKLLTWVPIVFEIHVGPLIRFSPCSLHLRLFAP